MLCGSASPTPAGGQAAASSHPTCGRCSDMLPFFLPSCVAGQAGASIVLLEWGKYFRRDSWAGQAAVARFAPRKALTLLQVDRQTCMQTYRQLLVVAFYRMIA